MAPAPRKPASVTYLPSGKSVQALSGDTLLDAALDSGLDLPHECGGNCTCTTCHVVVEEGEFRLSAMEPPEDDRLGTSPLRQRGSRLACQALLTGGEVIVRVVGC